MEEDALTTSVLEHRVSTPLVGHTTACVSRHPHLPAAPTSRRPAHTPQAHTHECVHRDTCVLACVCVCVCVRVLVFGGVSCAGVAGLRGNEGGRVRGWGGTRGCKGWVGGGNKNLLEEAV